MERTRVPRVADDLTVPGPGPAAADARLERLVAATSRYCLDTYLPRVLPHGPATPTDEGSVRPISSAALSLAVAARCGALDPQVEGARAVAAAVAAVQACVRGHLTVGGAWGRSWQSPLGTAQLALAAWLLGERVPSADAEAVRRVVADEADLLCGTPVHYLRDVRGVVLTPGDTGAEEESWRARGLSIALARHPQHAHAQRWFRWLVLRQVVAYAQPSDVLRTDALHRSPLCAWLGGSNAEEDGSLQNHGYLPQPNYMRPVHHLVAVTQQRLAGHPVSPSALHGVEALYEALRRLYREDGGLDYPGGTDVPSRAVVLYANDALHRAVGLGGEEALRWEDLHGEIAERQVQPDGSVVEPGGVELFGPVQPDIAVKLAECLLAARLGPLAPRELDGSALAGPPAQTVPTGCSDVSRGFPDTADAVAAAASWLHARGVLVGLPDGSFAPGRTVDRATAIVSLFRVAGSPPAPAPHGFADAPSDGGELDRALRWGVAEGLVRGTGPGTVAPRAGLTRGQAVVLLWRSQSRPESPPSGFTDVDGEVATAAGWARAAGITQGRTPSTFDAGTGLTRGEWALMLHRQHAVG